MPLKQGKWIPNNICINIDVINTRKLYTLDRPLIVELENGAVYPIPVGFYTDFGSIPKVLQSVISSWDRKCLVGFVLHDYLYYTGKVSRLTADKALLELMKKYGAGFIKRHTIYRSVRAGGWLAWNEHRKRKDK